MGLEMEGGQAEPVSVYHRGPASGTLGQSTKEQLRQRLFVP